MTPTELHSLARSIAEQCDPLEHAERCYARAVVRGCSDEEKLAWERNVAWLREQKRRGQQ